MTPHNSQKFHGTFINIVSLFMDIHVLSQIHLIYTMKRAKEVEEVLKDSEVLGKNEDDFQFFLAFFRHISAYCKKD